MSCESKTIYNKTNAEVIMHCLYHEGDEVETPKSLLGIDIDVDFVSPKTGEVLSSCSTENGLITILEDGSFDIGRYTVHAGVATNWPEGDMPVDVMYTRNDVPFYTEDFIMAFGKGRSKKDTP